MKRAAPMVLLGFIACVPREESPPVVVAQPLVPAPVVPPPRRNLFVASTVCDPTSSSLCPVFPPFPEVVDFYYDAQRHPCVNGRDRYGCLDVDGWHFTAGTPPPATPGMAGQFERGEPCGLGGPGWLVPLTQGQLLAWRPTGERAVGVGQDPCRLLPSVPLEPIQPDDKHDGIAASEHDDVWAWSSRFLTHWDGVRWERTLLPPPCTRESLPSPVAAPDGTIWFVRCEEKTRTLVRFDPRSNDAMATSLSPVLGLALVGEKVTATDFSDEGQRFRRHVFDAEGRDTAADDSGGTFLRAGFPDGTTFSAGFGLFNEIQRSGGDKIAQTIELPAPAEGFYAPTPREVWAGGAMLHRWRDGMMEKVPYRSDAGKSVVNAIGGSGPGDVWVASRPARGGDRERTVVHLSHWNGSTWSQMDLPREARGIGCFAVAGPNDAWLTTESRLWHWNGASWTQAGEFPPGPGTGVVLAGDAVFVLGNNTIYRRAR